MVTADTPPTHRWSHEPLEETLDGARPLSVSVADRMTRGGWDAMARAAGIPARRWRHHHPLQGDVPLVALVDGRPAFDLAAWERFVSLVPGAVALPTRTAQAFGVERSAIDPPGRAPLRLLDLFRARRTRARARRALRTLDADHARHASTVARAVTVALAPGEGGSPLATLPPYALAARLELLLDSTADWEFPAAVDLASATATMRLLHLLADRGHAAEAAYEQLAAFQVGGGVPRQPHLEELADIDDAAPAARAGLLVDWLEGAYGWHAARDLIVESPPLRDDVDSARRAAARSREADRRQAVLADLPVDDAELGEATTRSRQLVAMRELVARDRAMHVAGIRAIVWTLARSLASTGALEDVDDAFDLDVAELVRLARGGDPAVTVVRPAARPFMTTSTPDVDIVTSPASDFPRQVRGLAASRGIATGPVVVLDDPSLDADVAGAVLVCRVTDPAWLPLMLQCAALVTERGGPLSHAAIVARELGLPAVVGATGVRAAAADARTATVDGGAGIVAFDPSA